MKKIILVTGATSGFGKAIAEKFAAANYAVIITGRRQEKLEEFKRELEEKFETDVLTLGFDVRDRKAVFEAIESLPESWRKINMLVNNAGLALGRDLFEDADIDDWDTMIDTNVKGLLYVSKAVIPLMIEQGSGHVINMGSIAGKEVYERGNGYCASKYAVDAISKAMRIDLLRHQIKVTAIHPGAAETEFSLVRFKGDAKKASEVYQGYQALSANDIAGVVFYCAELPAHVCINDLIITCTAQANSFSFHRT